MRRGLTFAGTVVVLVLAFFAATALGVPGFWWTGNIVAAAAIIAILASPFAAIITSWTN